MRNKEKDRRLEEKFISGLNNGDIITEIIRELTAIKKTNEIISEQVLGMGHLSGSTKGPENSNRGHKREQRF